MGEKKSKLDQEPGTRSPFERFADLVKRVVSVPKEQADQKRKSA